ncbi:MAG: RnfABCDGE type electron transport complex subunit D [Ruthenibacterium sp.]
MAMDESRVLPRHPAHAAQNDMIYMTLPLLAMSAYLYGLRPLGLCAVAVLTANLCDRLVASIRRLPYDKTENSSIAFALIVTLLMPASVPYYIVIVTTLVTVLIGKAAFGGYGAYPFSPPAIGFAMAAISWPEEVFFYPVPFTPLTLFSRESAVVIESASHTLAAGGMPNIDLSYLFLGNYAGSMGATASLIIVACAAYLWMRKRITLAAPLGFLAMCAFIAYFFPRLGGIGLALPWHFIRFRLLTVLYELLSGAILYAAVFLINDPVTLPKRQDARFVYGVVLGFATMMFRYYGSYDMGVCFALLWVNVLSGPLDRWMSALSQQWHKRLRHGARKERPARPAAQKPAAKSARKEVRS